MNCNWKEKFTQPALPTSAGAVQQSADRPDEVIVAGEVAEIRFPKGGSLSLLASKLFVQLLDLAGADVAGDRAHRATLARLNWAKRDLDHIERAIDELHGTRVALTVNTRGGRRRRSGVVLADVDRPEDNEGEIEWRFSKTFHYVIANSRHWAAISARAVLAMESKYAVWLYQLAALHFGRDKISEDWDLAALRERLGASAPSLRRWQDFKRYVLEPACAEINQLTGIGVAWEPIKYGRKVMGVRLSTWRKSAASASGSSPGGRHGAAPGRRQPVLSSGTSQETQPEISRCGKHHERRVLKRTWLDTPTCGGDRSADHPSRAAAIRSGFRFNLREPGQ